MELIGVPGSNKQISNFLFYTSHRAFTSLIRACSHVVHPTQHNTQREGGPKSDNNIIHLIIHGVATPRTPTAPVTKNIMPMYSPEIQSWDFNMLELLEQVEEGGSLATNNSSQLILQPCISREYVGLMFLAGPPGVALVLEGSSVQD